MRRRLQTTVLDGGRLEIRVPELQPGEVVDVVINSGGAERRLCAFENLERYAALPIFETAEEVDAFIRSERESWER